MQNIPQIEKDAELAIKAMEKAFNVSISLHDMRGTICHPGGKPALPERHKHRHPCCLLGRDVHSAWDEECFKTCFSKSEMDAAKDWRPFQKKCWKGLTELVVPLIAGNRHRLTIYAGAFRETGSQVPKRLARNKAYERLFDELPELPGRKRLAEMGRAISFFGRGLLGYLYDIDATPDISRGAVVRAFIDENAHRTLFLKDLAEHLHLSPSRTSHAVMENTGMSFQELLLKTRIERAVVLLERSRDSLSEIASRLGFKNEFYFNRAFKKLQGTPPGRFRRERQDWRKSHERRRLEEASESIRLLQ